MVANLLLLQLNNEKLHDFSFQAFLLSFLLIGGATFWPTVGLQVISGKSASLHGKLVSCFDLCSVLKNNFTH